MPVYNEQDNLEPLYQRLCEVFDKETQYSFELLFTDNHSEDQTFERLIQMAKQDKRIRVLRFSRNFGFQPSIMTNFLNAKGEAAIQLDCDLQDPPELIHEFLRHWEEGYKVVYGVRRTRPEVWWLHALRRCYYRMIDFISEDHLPHDAGDFRLIDRAIIELLRRNKDKRPYLRGLIASMGFKQIGIPYDREARFSGRSKFNLPRLFSLAFDGILQHSTMPLRIASYVGITAFILAFLGALYYITMRLFFQTHWPVGLASSSVLLLLSIGMNGIFLGIIGEYVGRIYKNMKNEPLTIIDQTISHTELDVDSYDKKGS